MSCQYDKCNPSEIKYRWIATVMWISTTTVQHFRFIDQARKGGPLVSGLLNRPDCVTHL